MIRVKDVGGVYYCSTDNSLKSEDLYDVRMKKIRQQIRLYWFMLIAWIAFGIFIIHQLVGRISG